MSTRMMPPPPKIEPMEPGQWDKWLDRVKSLHAEILARRGGKPVEVDDILDEMRGRTDSGCS